MTGVPTKLKVVAVLLSMAVFLLVLAAPAYGQEGGLIAGRVINGTTDGTTVEGVPVSLHILGNGEVPDVLAVITDSNGRFVLEEPPESADGYMLVATYQDVDYSVEVAVGDDLSDVALTVYEPTSSLENVAVSMNSVLVVGIDSEARRLSVMELVLVENTGDRIFVTNINEGGPMNLLRFPLPPNAINLLVQTELPQGEVIQVDTGFAITAAVPPGEYSMAFTYTAPYTERRLDFSRQFLQGVGSFRFLVPEGIGSVTGPTLESIGITEIGETTFQVLHAENIARGDSVTVALGDLAGPSVSRRIMDQLRSPAWSTVVAVALIVALGVLVVLGVIRARTWRGSSTSEDVLDDREALVRAVAALDDRYDMGEVEEEEYREQRQVLKARLVVLTQEEDLAP